MPTQTQISLSPISAKGDLLSFDGSSRSRVAVGTNGQILSASSTDTSGIKWVAPPSNSSGAFELIASSVLTADGTIEFTGLSALVVTSSTVGKYSALHLYGQLRSISTGSESVMMSGKFNNDSGSFYSYARLNHDTTATTASAGTQGPGAFYNGVINTDSSSTGYFTPFEMVIVGQFTHNHVTTSNWGCVFWSRTQMSYTGATGNNNVRTTQGCYESSNVLNSLQFTATNAGGSFKAGSSLALYGYKRTGV
jgi:hypothetical protein